MKKILLILFSLFLSAQSFEAQNIIQNTDSNRKPKVALVLSGGGAKGIAHIPLLQKLDSLGIVPDLIVGNSMGSIVGGLYAMGYSGDSIASIAKNAHWDKLIGGGVALRDVSVEEKSEFDKYLIGMDIVKGKIKQTSFIINDQNIRAFFSDLIYPVYFISDFDNLPIPFRAIATDIVNGKEVILDKGNLGFAMRASMSIPGAFSPVVYENTLLVDGGVLNNFPVDVAKNLGADIIIGSDVGGGMKPKDKLDNISALIFQTGMLHSNLKNPENRLLCDVLIDHTPHILYSTGDFDKSIPIYESGKIAPFEKLTSLVAIAEKLKVYQQKKVILPKVGGEIVLDTILYENISKSNLALVKARTNIQPYKKYSRKDIFDGINRAMGTTIFSHLTFDGYTDNKKKGLQLTGFERSQHQVNGSLHYDSYHGFGIIANFRGRNVLGGASRTLITLDIAEEPRLRLQHQKNFGLDRAWWWRTEVYGHQLEQDIFISGESVENLKYRFIDFNNQVNRNLNSLKSYMGVGIKYQNTHFKPKVNPNYNNNVYDLRLYDFNNLELNMHYVHNSFDKVFFANNGTYFKGYLSRSLNNSIDLKFFNSEQSNINGKTNSFSKFILDYEKRFELTNKTTVVLGATSGFIFQDDISSNSISFAEYGVGGKYFLGGVLLEPRNDNYILPGLYEGELLASQFMKISIGMQFNPKSKLYVTPHTHIATIGFNDFDNYITNAFSAKGKWEEAIETSLFLSAGTTLSYNSILGPVNIDLSWVNNTNKLRLFIGVGFNLNRSD